MNISLLYNPQEMPEQQFIDGFVVRHAILQKLLKPINDTLPGEPFKHVIIQSLRGQGKTTLLRKISLCVRDDDNLSAWLIPVLFREEEYGIINLCRLWERTADYLKHLAEFKPLPDEFEQAYASPHYEKDCFKILGDALQKHDKHLLLLIDNLGEMLNKFGIGDQQRLREILQTCSRIRIIGASSATLEQHYDHGKPFFQFFRIQTLDGLEAEETQDLLLSLGNKSQKQRIKKLLQENPGKVEALRRLTSGVPRTLILLFEIFSDKDGSALQDLEQLLDRVTPLYKHRLDDLPPQQQQITQEIALGWDAMSVKEIAQKTRLPSKLVSAQLQQLERSRIVRKISTSTKNHLYQLKERFFNIWCLMRLGRPGDKRRAAWLVKFLETWCDHKEMARLATDHIKAIKKGKMNSHAAFLRTQALAYALRDFALQEDLLTIAKAYLPSTESDALPMADKAVFDAATLDYSSGEHDKAFESFRSLAEKGYAEGQFSLAFILEKRYQIDKAIEYYRKAAEQGNAGAMNNLAHLLEKQNKPIEAEQLYRQAATQGYAYAMTNLAVLLDKQNKPDEAEPLFRQAVAQGSVGAMQNLAVFLYRQNKLDEAISFIKQAVNLKPEETRYSLFYGFLELIREEYLNAFKQIQIALTAPNASESFNDTHLYSSICHLCAKNQTAFALKLFEDECYQHLNLKERLKPLYYAVLQEAGEAYKDQALRMGPELAETVAEIRQAIAELRTESQAKQ
jgi:TPR repeat protein